MKAIVLTAYGDVDKLETREVPDPKPAPGEIMVRMAGASINPVDWKLRTGALQAMMPLALPTILGRDASGEVVQVGSNVVQFKVGDRVMGLVMGAYAELVVAAEDAWALVPEAMNLVDAAALPLVLLTGAQLVEEALCPQNGDVVLITGATGSVGRAAVFTAKARGAKVWAAVRQKHMKEAASLGVDGVVVLDDGADLNTVPRLDGIADTVGGETVRKLLGKLKPGGIIASVVGEPPGAKELGLKVHAMLAHPDSRRLTDLGKAVADGRLIIPIAKKLPLSEAREAQTLAEDDAHGKIILVGSLDDLQLHPTKERTELTQYLIRDRIQKLLSDVEIARVSTAESAPKLAHGDEYIDLEQLGRGVLRANGSVVAMGHILPRKAVQEATWTNILSQLVLPKRCMAMGRFGLCSRCVVCGRFGCRVAWLRRRPTISASWA
jgi:NADPH:quinone reductase-like Zn-dependent oxidoreductase